jgi:hypothetical protein
MKDNLVKSHKSGKHDVLGKNLLVIPKKVNKIFYYFIHKSKDGVEQTE